MEEKWRKIEAEAERQQVRPERQPQETGGAPAVIALHSWLRRDMFAAKRGDLLMPGLENVEVTADESNSNKWMCDIVPPEQD